MIFRLRAGLRRIMNGVPDSAAARYPETYNERNLLAGNYQRWHCQGAFLSSRYILIGMPAVVSRRWKIRRNLRLVVDWSSVEKSYGDDARSYEAWKRRDQYEVGGGTHRIEELPCRELRVACFIPNEK